MFACVNGVKKWRLLLFTFGLILAVFFVYTWRHQVYSVLYEWKLIPRPEHFTELYFENYKDLPKTVAVGQSIVFAFAVHNLEGERVEYPYEVYSLSGNGTRSSIKQDRIFIDNNGFKTVDISYIFPESEKKETVFVVLTSMQQDIHFTLIAE